MKRRAFLYRQVFIGMPFFREGDLAGISMRRVEPPVIVKQKPIDPLS